LPRSGIMGLVRNKGPIRKFPCWRSSACNRNQTGLVCCIDYNMV
jgi:hypothetical protein